MRAVDHPDSPGQPGIPGGPGFPVETAFIEQNRLFGELTRAAEPSTPVPSCPEWTVRQLVTHVGRGDRWAAEIVRGRAETYVDIRTVAEGKPPADPDDAVRWLQAGAQSLVDAVHTIGAATPVWTFVGPRPASWWVRRRLHEATVHRADAALALGAAYHLAPEVAADGVSEWLDLLAARPPAAAPLTDGATLHLHATDEGLGAAGEWMIRADGGRVTWEHGHAKGDTAVRAGAADLLCGLLRRPAGDLDIRGDAELWSTWLERTGF